MLITTLYKKPQKKQRGRWKRAKFNLNRKRDTMNKNLSNFLVKHDIKFIVQ